MKFDRRYELIAGTPLQPVIVKSKTTSILLAVFLAFGTWLYTYKSDSWKFWVGLAVTISSFGFGLPLVWVWAVIDTALKSDEWYGTYPNGDLLKKQAELERGHLLEASLEARRSAPAPKETPGP